MNPIVYLTRRATFSAAHRLHEPSLSETENRILFGKCNNPNGHGHNYTIEVTVKKEVNPQTGMVMNLVDLKNKIEEEICDKIDHKHLNQDVPEFLNLNPTAENMVVVFWNLLKNRFESGVLYEVKLHETENNVVFYRGEMGE